MARTALTVQTLTGPYPATLLMDTLTWTAADLANKNSVVFTGKEIIIARNDDAGEKNVIITSIADPQKRVGNITKAMATGTYAIFLASALTGFIQADGLLYLEADDVEIFFAVVRFK